MVLFLSLPYKINIELKLALNFSVKQINICLCVSLHMRFYDFLHHFLAQWLYCYTFTQILYVYIEMYLLLSSFCVFEWRKFPCRLKVKNPSFVTIKIQRITIYIMCINDTVSRQVIFFFILYFSYSYLIHILIFISVLYFGIEMESPI